MSVRVYLGQQHRHGWIDNLCWHRESPRYACYLDALYAGLKHRCDEERYSQRKGFDAYEALRIVLDVRTAEVARKQMEQEPPSDPWMWTAETTLLLQVGAA